MYTHDLDPILFDFGLIAIRWYSLAYIFGILIGWWLGKKIILKRFANNNFDTNEFDNLITYIIIFMLLGGRVGYVLFYNFGFYLLNPLDIFKIWEGGMSFHGALAGIIFVTYWFSIKRNIQPFFLLDIIAFVAPIGIFFGRLANFINGELVGKVTDVYWGVIP
jgi:prolipoprotein diacylglyceryl transferase